MPRVLKMPSLVITNEYIEKFKRADKTFKYQIVFNPLTRKRVPLHDYQSDVSENEDLKFAGEHMDEEKALQHSLGNLHVNNGQVVYNFDPEYWNYKPPSKHANNTPNYMLSVWSANYKTFSGTTPFSSMSCSAKSVTQSVSLSTFGKSKTLNSYSYTRRESLASECFKRKRGIDEDSIPSSSSSSLASSSAGSFSSSYESDVTIITTISSSGAESVPLSSIENREDKRVKLEKTMSEVDVKDLLSQYSNENKRKSMNSMNEASSQKSEPKEQEEEKVEEETSSPYFRNKPAKKIESPSISRVN